MAAASTAVLSVLKTLSTLRLQPHDHTRMTRGRCGSLCLHRNGLAASTFRRSPGAPVHSINRVIAIQARAFADVRSSPNTGLKAERLAEAGGAKSGAVAMY